MTNKCEHIELSTTHPTRARDFYSKLFGWKVKAVPDPDGTGEYLMFQTDNGGGGITAKMSPEQPTAWMPYITVDSIDAMLEDAQKLGGDQVLGNTPIGDMGAVAVLRDPTGAAIGLWESAKKPAAKAKAAKPAAKAPAKAAKKPASKSKGKAKGKAKSKGKG